MQKEYHVVVTYADDLPLSEYQLEELLRRDASVEGCVVTVWQRQR